MSYGQRTKNGQAKRVQDKPENIENGSKRKGVMVVVSSCVLRQRNDFIETCLHGNEIMNARENGCGKLREKAKERKREWAASC